MNLEKIRKKNNVVLKVDAVKLLIESFNITIEDVLKNYEGENFRDTEISKKEVFHQVLSDTLSETNRDYLKIMGNLSHHRDGRTPVEYCKNLIYGWLSEDVVLTTVQLKSIPVKLYGTDNVREFLLASEITTEPDLEIGTGENTRLVEVFCDWKGSWEKYSHADLRDNKYKRLVNENSLLLGLSPVSGKGFLLNMSDETHGFYSNKVYGYHGKKGYTCDRISEFIKPMDEVLKDLYDYFI